MSLLYVPEHIDFNSPAVSRDCLAHVYGNAADHPDRVRRYPSDMTDAEWAAVRPLKRPVTRGSLLFQHTQRIVCSQAQRDGEAEAVR